MWPDTDIKSGVPFLSSRSRTARVGHPLKKCARSKWADASEQVIPVGKGKMTSRCVLTGIVVDGVAGGLALGKALRPN